MLMVRGPSCEMRRVPAGAPGSGAGRVTFGFGARSRSSSWYPRWRYFRSLMTIRVYRNASTALLVDVALAARRHLRRVRSTATDALLRHRYSLRCFAVEVARLVRGCTMGIVSAGCL